ncbi:MAG: ClpXP protease specificity-enhancing factor SspB [Henriciella sp.]|nr:ClpXP protease specificity-enhancing factor SspB [Henriciella sp.]
MTDYIGYEALTQAAMRGVVREALRQAAKGSAPPGDHHFYITFRSKAPGVRIADHLIERFPDEMTIVIQHQYWDLEVHDGHFEIVLKFNGVPQHLSIPFAAMTRFVDPAVNFGVSFEKAASGEAQVVDPAPEDSKLAIADTDTEASDDSDTVVSLDAFRQK